MTVLLPPFHHFHHFCHFLSLVANTSPVVSCQNVPTALERCSNARGTIFYDLKIIDVVTIATFLPLFRRFFVAFSSLFVTFRHFFVAFRRFFCCFFAVFLLFFAVFPSFLPYIHHFHHHFHHSQNVECQEIRKKVVEVVIKSQKNFW